MSFVLSMKEIYKSFNSVPVLKGVTLEVGMGEIHALLGENGAGKSTLMNILGGILKPDSGTIDVFGETFQELDTRKSRDIGIAFVHQELNLVDDMTVYENVFLGEELKNRFGILIVKEMQQTAREIMKQLDVELDVNQLVGSLDASQKQIVEIAKALRQKAKLIILDEPTASLTEKEIDQVIKVMKTLKQNNVAMIFISHKLKEVIHVCDRYTVLRDGEMAATDNIWNVDEGMLAKYMVGTSLTAETNANRGLLSSAKVLLEGRELTCQPYFKNVSFQLYKGEILGFTGLIGDGHSEVFECVFGARKLQSGKISFHGKQVLIRKPSDAKKFNIGYIPKNRKQNGIIPDLSVIENASVSSHKKYYINEKNEHQYFNKLKELLNIKAADSNVYITSLSGGNQQKIMLSKWLLADAEIFILDTPTQGVDIGAKEEIYRLIESLAKEGKSFIVLSSEFQEIMRLCNRVVVMYQGEIMGELDSSECSEERLMLLSTGNFQGGQSL